MGLTEVKSPEDPLIVNVTTSDCLSQNSASQVIAVRQNSPCDTPKAAYQRINDEDDLFYAPVLVEGKVQLLALVDSGSVTCTLSESAERTLKDCNLICTDSSKPTKKVLTGCGGNETKPKCTYELSVDMLECKMTINFLVVPGQKDDMIVGSNVIRHVTRQMMKKEWYWKSLSQPVQSNSQEPLLNVLSNVERWHGDKIPQRVGTVVLRQCVTLEPQHEHLVWGRLKEEVPLSVGSTVMLEPSTSRSAPRNVMVARSVCPLWGDKWIPMRVINMIDRPIVLRRNTKIAHVHPCLALEELDLTKEITEYQHKGAQQNIVQVNELNEKSKLQTDYKVKLRELGLTEIDIESCEVSEFWKRELVDLIGRYESTFSRDKLDCGEVKNTVHRIRLKDEKPFRLPYRRVPPNHYQKLRQTLNEMEERGIIRKSNSEWASPLVLVWKPSGELRICTDFRWLNQRTEKDAYPLPHQADALASLGGNCYFSTMDLTSGFYNIPIHEDDRKYTACTTPVGLYEYNRMAQGLCNSPATFSRMMTSIFGDQNYLSLLCYLDDLLVFGKTEKEALDRLEMVFSRLREHNLKLAQKKCYFLRKTVKFLGHIVTESGIATDPTKVSAISNIKSTDLMEADGKTPSPTKIKSFLGMANYYSHFIEGLSTLARPLFKLTVGQKVRRKDGQKTRYVPNFRRLSPEDWTEECDTAVDKIKHALSQTVVLAHPDFKKPFLLSTDASMDGFGAVLSQIPEGETKPRPVAFASKTLSKAQSHYPAHRLEFCALKWAVCDKFAHWLKGTKFTVLTDNNPLTYILSKPKLDACEQRWVSKLAPFDFDLRYIPGTKNVPADLLSRRPFARTLEVCDALETKAEHVTSETVQDTFRLSVNVHHRMGESSIDSQVEKLKMVSSEGVKAVFESCLNWEAGSPVHSVHLAQNSHFVLGGVSTLPVFSIEEICMKQKADPTVSRVVFFVDRKRRPSRRERDKETAPVMRLLKHWEKLEVKDGVLYRRSKDRVGKVRHQLVLPHSLRTVALRGTHDDAGHQGQSRTLHLVRQRFFWSGMDTDVKKYVSHCKRCVVGKTQEPEARAPLESIRTSAPLELVCIDFWSAEGTHGESVDVLVITDHFTKLAHAFPCPNQTAKVVAQKLWNNFFCVYGFPQRIHSDKGANFESKLIAELLLVSGVDKSHTTPYHPMGNGQTERFNRTLGSMIRSLPPRAKERWPQMIQTLTFSYNCTTHETTGFAPFYLMFGRIPRLPVDVMFGSALRNEDVQTYDEYVKSLQKDLKEAMHIAKGNATDAQRRQTEGYNKRSKGAPLEVGDRVLLANKKERGKGKLADVWNSAVHVVTWKDPSLPIYRVENPTTKNSKVVHRNFLLPVNFLPLEEPDTESTVLSVLSEENQTEGRSQTSLLSTERESENSRTAVWILQGVDPKAFPSTGECIVKEKSKEPVTELEHSNCVSQTREKSLSTRNKCKQIGSSSDEYEARGMNSDSEQSDDDNSIHELEPDQLCISNGKRTQEYVSNQSVQAESIVMSNDASSMSRSVRSSKHQGSSCNSVHSQKKTQRTGTVADTALKPNEGTLRTRAGRLVRPVRRLLECMSMMLTESGQKDSLADLLQILSNL